MSARISPSKELPQTAKALQQLKASSRHRKTQIHPVTHRCRVYLVNTKGIRKDKSVYTVVWDTLEHPFKSRALPQGEVYFATSGSSPDVVGEEIERFCEGLGRVEITDWHAAGSI